MDHATRENHDLRHRIDALTDPQRECLSLASKRLSSKEIARVLGISKDTVDKRIQRAMVTLGVTSRLEALRLLDRMDEHSCFPAQIYQRVVYGSTDDDADPDMIKQAMPTRGNGAFAGESDDRLNDGPTQPIRPSESLLSWTASIRISRKNTLSVPARAVLMGFFVLVFVLAVSGVTTIINNIAHFH